MMSAVRLELKQISKFFGDFKALDRIDLDVVQGSIHAILGENGAGKTTLMNILYGLYQPDSGYIVLNGRKTAMGSPREAMDLSIGMIHQHFMLVDSLTVAENVVLGLPGQGVSLSLKQHAAQLADLGASLGFDIDPFSEIWKLPIGMRQRVEILKVLYRDASLIIFDEPTSVLAPNEIAGFLDGLRRLRAAGKTIIFITHKIEEVMQVSDRITIMRHGKVTAETDIADTDARQVARLMVGRDIASGAGKSPAVAPGEIVVSARDLRARDNRGIETLKGVSFQIRAGEILGIAGVDGNGQAELAEVLTGLRAPESGTVTVRGEDITALSAHERRHKAGMSCVPEDRHGAGLVLDRPVTHNAMLRDFTTARFSNYGVLRKTKVRKITQHWVERYDIRLRSIDQNIRFLSGGNQQKLIFAREIECAPGIMVVMQPCKGLDVGAIEAVQRALAEQRARGVAILYISTELEHILALCDQVAVMCGGEITGILPPEQATGERIGALMGGLGQAVADAG